MFFEPAPTPFDLRFSLLGVPVRVHPMHWVVAAILGSSLLSIGAIYLLAWVICVFLSVLLHEMGHILMGRLFGSDGHIVLYGFGGLAIPYHFLRSRWQRIAVSLAGPLIQLVLYAILKGIVAWLKANDKEVSPQAKLILGLLLEINLWWPILNLLPIWPLDGGRITREVCSGISPRVGARGALILSIGVSGILAIHYLAANYGHPLIPFLGEDIYLALLFGYLMMGSFSALQHENARRVEWNDEPRVETEDDADAWKR